MALCGFSVKGYQVGWFESTFTEAGTPACVSLGRSPIQKDANRPKVQNAQKMQKMQMNVFERSLHRPVLEQEG